jgi:hypothetical protein
MRQPTHRALLELSTLQLMHVSTAPWPCQHCDGAAAGLLRRRRAPRLVILNPILRTGDSSARQRMVLSGLQRADCIVMYSRSDALQVVHPKDHRAFLDLLEGAAALVVPLQGGDPQAGQLAILVFRT